MTDRAFQQCINPACASTYAISEVHVACRKCGALLDIKYDWDRLPVPRSLSYFEHRWSTKGTATQGRLDFSGVWRFREMMPFFRDIHDHLTRIADLSESYRDLIGGALDSYLSVVSNRTNDIMKVLTIFSAINPASSG